MQSDGELVTAVLGGATECFAELVRRYDRRVRAIVAERVRGRDAREELVHQTFYLAFRHLDRLEDRERLEPWLARIAARCAVEHVRREAEKRGRMRSLEDGEIDRATMERREWIWEEVERLPRLLGEVLVLRYRMRLSYREIAERLGVPSSTVRGRIHQARRALRARLDLDGEAGERHDDRTE
jgi:RNA polymerase sigma-70 factor (ECF subfamily)